MSGKIVSLENTKVPKYKKINLIAER